MLLQCLGFALVAWRLAQLGLASSFRWFFCLCLFEPVRLAVATPIPRGTNAYGYYYFATQPIVWTLFIVIILDLFRSVFSEHPAIYTLSRKALTACIVTSVTIAVATLGFELRDPGVQTGFFETFLVAERTVALSLVVFVLLLMLILSWFPVPINRNALAHAVIFSFYFAAKAALFFSRNLFGVSFTRAANVGLLSVVVICLVAWLVFLVRQQDAKIVRSGVRRDPEAEERLMQQLNAINETLAGSVRK